MKIIFTCILVCFIQYCFSANLPAVLSGDTTIKKEYKIDREEFLEKYGCDDSSRALINFYFKKRNQHKGSVIAGSVLLAIAGLSYFLINVSLLNDDKSYVSDFPSLETYIAIANLIALAYSGIPMVLSSAPLLIAKSRKKLLTLLNNYYTGKSIPRGIIKNRMFRGYLRYDRWDSRIKKQMKLEELIQKNVERKRLMDERRKRKTALVISL